MSQISSDPDLIRPLRTNPVRREEVLVHPDRFRLLTMPLGTFTYEKRVWDTDADGEEFVRPYLVGAPTLWAAVLSEIAAEHAKAVAARQQLYERTLANGWRLAAWMTQPLPFEAKPLFEDWWAREYVCEICGLSYLGVTYYRWWRSRHRVCSNHCEHERRAMLRRQRRRDNPPPSWQAHAARTAQRAAAREGRQCAHCGVPIEAARSTRHFCSDICRVNAHRINEAAKKLGQKPGAACL